MIDFGFISENPNNVCNVAPEDRTNCGYAGIDEARCLQRGCCYDNSTPGVPWCFFKKGDELLYFVHSIFCLSISDSMPISPITTWGPSFTVSLDVKVHSFTPPNLKHGAWAELLRLTTTDNDCCRIGDRAPAIFTHKDGYLHITTQIGNNGNRVWDITIQEKRWYSLELSQYKLHDKVTQLPRCPFLPN